MDCYGMAEVGGVLLNLNLGGSEEICFGVGVGECRSWVDGRVLGKVRFMVFPSWLVVFNLRRRGTRRST